MQKHDAAAVLQKYFGYDSFRRGQRELIEALLAGRDCLGVMPTGAGKSICYQVPALIWPGVTLVISPLISLMKDQVDSLQLAGVAATFINSQISPATISKRLQKAAAGEYKIVYVAPERLMSGELSLIEKKLKAVIVDEAHCVSQWGHDFRPSYAKIADYLQSLPQRVPVGAFTATATAQVKADIIKLLQLKKPLTLTTGFDRANLYFGVNKEKHKLKSVLAYVKNHRQQNGIIYCLSRKNVELVHEQLVAAGWQATRYHAGLDEKERRENQDDFVFDRKNVMVATNAFGMGVNKSNVSYVLHYNMPKNLESYYQEAGRAGRDGEPAECILYYSGQDVRTNQWLIDHDDGEGKHDPAARAHDHELLKQMTFYCHTRECLRAFILRYFGDPSKVCCDNCSNCQTTFEVVDVTISAQKIISCILRLRQKQLRFGKTMVVNILRGSGAGKIKQFGLEKLSTYGVAKEESTARLYNLIDYLLELGYLQLQAVPFPVLVATKKALIFLKEKKTLQLKIPQEAPEKPDVAETTTALSAVDEDLLTKLKQLRYQLATAANLPAYIIFSNATLVDMGRRLPKNETELLQVSGVGQTKLERYGKIFLQTIAQHQANKESSG